MAAFQSEVVALPPGYESSMFTPPSHEAVTVANRYTDRLSHEDAIAFMRQSLEDADWHVTDQREPRRDRSNSRLNGAPRPELNSSW